MTLENPMFRPVRLRDGYEMPEVDDAIDKIFAALQVQPPTMTCAEVDALRFTPVKLREGYDMAEVDAWLDKACAELDARAHGHTPAQEGIEPPLTTDLPPQPPAPGGTPGEVQSNPMRGLLFVVFLVVLGLAVWFLTR